MGLFSSGIQPMTNKDVEAAVERIAQYYRQTRLYLSLCPGNDAYEFFKQEYTEDIRIMVNVGYCYKYKGNYLIATDVDDFFHDYPNITKHFYGPIPHIVRKMGAEKDNVIFINSLGPSTESCNEDTYKLIRDFVRMEHGEKSVFLSDATAGVDQITPTFVEKTGCRKLQTDGEIYYRWG